MLGVSRRYVWGLAREGKLPTVHIGRRLRFDSAAIDRWLASRTSGGEIDGQDPSANSDPAGEGAGVARVEP